ncbi:MAG TPA: serine O-acetyltransferase EpsC [Spirochaetota bacterium]|nr:serine O-acetyltransferase EpsC [Spirochaetota bacterium]
MKINKWLNKLIPAAAEKLEKNILKGFHFEAGEELNISGRKNIYKILDTLLAVLFPGAFAENKILKTELDFYINEKLRNVSYHLHKYIKEVLEHHCPADNCSNCSCARKAVKATVALIEKLPEIRNELMTDVNAALKGDPASNSPAEIILSYPCIEAIATYRVAHLLYKEQIPIIPRIMSERAHAHTGIDIHPGAGIDSSFFIDHGTGVVIGETTTIGKNVKIYQGVTLGATSPFDRQGKPRKGQKRHPDIRDDVIIYANATILGGKTVIGKGAVIGGNTWITESVNPGAKIYC